MWDYGITEFFFRITYVCLLKFFFECKIYKIPGGSFK